MEFEAALHIPSREPAQLEFATVIVATIPTKLANQLIKQLCSAFPLSDLKHLKRVNKPGSGATLQLILCAASDLQQPPPPTWDGPHSPPCPLDSLPAALQLVVQQHELQPVLAHAPAHAPQTREQWQEWGKLWPLNWKVPDQAVVVISVSEEDQQYFEVQMQAALQLASTSASDNAALIVDPLTQGIVAQGINSAEHPLDHASMVAIRAAAERDKQTWPDAAAAAAAAAVGPGAVVGLSAEGADAVPAGATARGGMTSVAMAAPAGAATTGQEVQGQGDARVCAGQSSGQHDAASPQGEADEERQAASKRPRIQPEALEGGVGRDREGGAAGGVSTLPPCEGGAGGSMQDANHLGAMQRASSHVSLQSVGEQQSVGDRPYMCTGYDCFLVREPCIMCAMALVHSRLQRVIYCHLDPQHGALGGRCRLHAQRSLNHHYQVFHLPLKQQR